MVASWLVRSSLNLAAWVRVLAGDVMLCSKASPTTLTVPLSTQVYKWVLDYDGLASHPGGNKNTPSRFILREPR